MQAVRRGGKRRSVWLGLIAGLCAFAIPATAAQAQEPWACDGAGYTTQFDATNPALGTLLFRVEQQPDGSLQRVQIGSLPAEHFNAIGFRPQDGFMYALNETTLEIMRISDDGTGAPEFESIGFPAGSGITPPAVVGTILDDGNYFVWDNKINSGAIFDVSGPTATLVTTIAPTTVGEEPSGDMAISPIDGELYSISLDPGGAVFGAYRFELDVAAGTITRGARVADATNAGAHWFVADGRFIQYNNGGPGPNGNGLYASNLETGELTFHGSGPRFSNADGTGCPNGLAVTKDADPRTVVAGAQVTYTHTITSRALGDSPVEFSDVLPAGMTYVPGGVTVSPASFGTPNDFGGTDTLEVSGTMSRGETVTITATAAVPSNTACGSDVENQSQATLAVPGLPEVTFDSDDSTTEDLFDDPTVIGVICEADVALTKAAPGRVDPNGNITWTMTVTNNGPSASSGSTVTDAIPPEVSDPATQTPGCAITNGTLECAIGALGVGDSTEVVVTGTAPTQANTSVTNAASVEGEQDDPVLENNSDSVQTSIRRGKPRLVIKKRTGNKQVRPGEVIRYRIKVRNKGNRTARGVRVCDKMPSGLRLLRAPKANKTKAHKACWWVKRLRAGKKRRFRVVAQVKTSTGAGKLTNRAMVKARNAKKRKRNKARVRVIQPPTSACRIPRVAARC